MPYNFNDEVINEIRDANDIVEVISSYVDLKKAGTNYKGLCPFHNEKTPSFMVSPSKEIFHCFGCGEGGDVITFLMKHRNLNFIEALETLAHRANIELPENNNEEDKKKYEEREKLFELNREAALYYYRNLKKNKKALEYLKRRQINYNIINRFGIGFANDSWDDLFKYLKNKGFSTELIYKVGLIVKRKDKSGYYNRFRNRIIFPIINIRGKIIGFGGRVIDNTMPKYLNTPDTPIFNKGYNLYGINILKKNISYNRAILVEGYMDVISLNSHGISYSVASLGTAFTEKQAELLNKYAKEFYICYDSDTAGKRATDKALEVFHSIGIKPRVIILPKGKDPDDFIKERGIKAFEKAIDKSLNLIDYKIYSLKKKFDISTVEGKIKFTEEISTFLKKIKNEIELDVYLNEISNSTGISLDAIRNQIYNKNKSNYSDRNSSNIHYRHNRKDYIMPVEYKLESGHIASEKSILNLIINDHNIYEKLKDDFNYLDFLNKENRELAKIIYKEYSDSKNLNIDNLKIGLEQNLSNRLDEILNLDSLVDDTDKAIQDYIDNINYYKLKIRREKIKKEIKNLGKKDNAEGEVQKLKELFMEFTEINKQLKMNH
ncbi:DNA primase [Senegalia massiliensis]|uniref:DNA primase n=1 Tax=Senegalia massiliensis TaxID=1720316 RepID=A0A845R0K0_9CLOT|nr:DNA primase [Senegalia massiliensis]NBI06998.1 DNA primase [Senegalia massiliensis]